MPETMNTLLSCCQTVGADAYVTTLLSESSPESFPLACTLDITERCNLACVHCYLGSRRQGGRADLSAEQANRIMATLADGGVLVLAITGGEPLLHPEFREIWVAAKRRGFLVSLFTNATVVDEALAGFLAAHPPRRVEVSVYGSTRATYELVTGVPGSHAKCLNGVRLLKDAGVRVQIKCPVLRANRTELEAIEAWAVEMGFTYRSDALIAPTLDGGTEPLAHRVPVGQVDCFCSNDAEVCTADVLRDHPCTDGSDRLVTCGAGLRTMHVDVTGYMHPCLLWRFESRSVLETSPRQWNAHMDRLRLERLPVASGCRMCAARSRCPACPALSQLEGGASGCELPYYCDLMREAGLKAD